MRSDWADPPPFESRQRRKGRGKPRPFYRSAGQWPPPPRPPDPPPPREPPERDPPPPEVGPEPLGGDPPGPCGLPAGAGGATAPVLVEVVVVLDGVGAGRAPDRAEDDALGAAFPI